MGVNNCENIIIKSNNNLDKNKITMSAKKNEIGVNWPKTTRDSMITNCCLGE